MRLNTIRAAAVSVLAAGLTVLAGCDLWQVRWAVQLPELPAVWRHLDVTFELTVVDGRSGAEQRLPDARAGSRLPLPAGRYAATVVLAEPRLGGTRRLALRPAGAVITARGAASGVLELSWEGGLLASLVLDLWRGGSNPRLLNLGRLEREIAVRAGADPWALDRTAILEALQSNAMRVTLIRPRPTHEVELRLPAGEWVWWNPFAAPLHSAGTGTVSAALPTGYHVLLADAGAARAVQVDDAGGVLLAPVP